ncbi:hypothetical protein LCGC14_2503970 [marine sediment metagenome]|uniref:LamG-like jellyroll fold domain-containing protein n=1 Tax=marine sediment metagenome TaxID=412755 RepID=A0A0F9B109_9ZZZZ
MRSRALEHTYARANWGLKFRPDANTVLWLPGQDDPQSATIRDRSGKGNDGAITGATWAQTGQGLWYLVLDGTDDYVTVTDSPSLDITAAITLKAWVYSGDVTRAAQSIIAKTTNWGTDGAYEMRFQGDNLRFGFYNGAFKNYTGGFSHVNNTWYHLVATYNSARIELYSNTAQEIGSAIVSSLVPDNADVQIGVNNQAGLSNDLLGRIALVEIHNKAWTLQEVINSREQERHLFGV